MFFEELTDDEWTRLAPLAADEPVHPHRRGRPRAEPRVVTNAVLWILTTGERWSKLPARYPSGPTCRRRFDDWLADGTLAQIVKMLSEFGRTFAYVPQQPEATVEAAPKAAPLPTPESPRLRGVFWTNPESWHTEDGSADAGVDAEVAPGAANGACTHTIRREVPVASSRRAPAHDVPLVESMTVTRRSEDYRGYVIHACVQPVEKLCELSYRASAEIGKDGRRVERSGLIGPRFADHASAERHALDWARDWIERHEAAAQPRPPIDEDVPAAAQPEPQPAAIEPPSSESAPVLAAAPASQPARALESAVIRSRTPDWRLHSHTHADSRGDTKPPELVYHA